MRIIINKMPAYIIAIFTFIIYLPVLQNDFVNWDDDIYIYENRHIQAIDSDFFSWVLTGIVGTNWHPLTMLSHALDYAIWGTNPQGHHLTNVVIHAINTLLVFILVENLIKTGKPIDNRGRIGAIMTAILFGVHPLHVESVAWAAERKDVLCAFFFLLAVINYLLYTTSNHTGKVKYYGFSLISFMCALLSKPMAVSLPAVLLILDAFPLYRLSAARESVRRVLLEKLPFLALSIFSSIITISASYTGGATKDLTLYPLDTRVFTAAKAYLDYLIKMVMPLNLAPLYPHPGHIRVWTFEYMGALLVILIITILSVIFARKIKPLSALWAYYLVTLLPVIGIIQVGTQAAADRYTYLPSLGPFLFAGIVTEHAQKSMGNRTCRIITFALLAAVLMLFSYRTIKQITVWRNSITLWSHEINLYPHVSSAYASRGNAYSRLNKVTYALKDLDKAIELNPVSYEAYMARGNLFDTMGNYDYEIKDFSKAIQLKPAAVAAYNNRGIAYSHMGNHVQALKDYNKSTELDPSDAQVYNNRGNAYSQLGRHIEAIDDFTTAIKLDDKMAEAYFNRGRSYRMLEMYREAIKDYDKAIIFNQKDADAFYYLGLSYSKLGDSERSRFYFNKAIQLGR